MRIFLKLFAESFLFAFDALRVNRLRTVLSLLGITIGIFTIIAVFTAVDSLKNQVTSSINKLGTNVIYIQKFPWGPEEGEQEYPWWKYIQRPSPKVEEYQSLKNRVTMGEKVSFTVDMPSRVVKYRTNSVENTGLNAISEEDKDVENFDFAQGRFFTDNEAEAGRNVCFIGAVVAEGLFRGMEDPIGKTIKVGGRPLVVVGVLAKEGDNVFGITNDNNVIVPLNYGKSLIDIQSDHVSPQIIIKGPETLNFVEEQGDVEMAFRSIRKLRPGQKKNFAINNPSIITKAFESISGILDIAGWVIGGFSILVGGFGIANIMFVSVKERTSIIGIQKSLGAKNYFILLQFLVESVVLCIFGGLIGLFMVWGGTWVLLKVLHLNMPLHAKNIVTGIGLSVVIGVISGFWPALSASRLDPVEAIRS